MYATVREIHTGAPRRPWHPQPGRLNPSEAIAAATTNALVREVESDWLWQQVGAEGRRRLLVERGLLAP